MIEQVVGAVKLLEEAQKPTTKAWRFVTRYSRYWEHVESEVVGFAIEARMPSTGNAKLEVRVMNFSSKSITAQLWITSWSVVRVRMPDLVLSSPPVPLTPRMSKVLVVPGSPGEQELALIDKLVPREVQRVEGCAVSLPVTLVGELHIGVGRKAPRVLPFNKTFEFCRIRLAPYVIQRYVTGPPPET
jgi:hypothetical protein